MSDFLLGDVGMLVLRSEIPSSMCTKLRTVAASNNGVHMPWSLHYCLFTPHICMVLFFMHMPFVVNHTFNTTSPERLQQHPLLFTTNRTDRTFFVWRLTLTSWSQHHFVAIGNPERHMCKASHCGSKQQWSSHAMITLLLLVRAIYMYSVVLQAHPVRGESHI